jgi:hypothetical protein
VSTRYTDYARPRWPRACPLIITPTCENRITALLILLRPISVSLRPQELRAAIEAARK